MTKLSVNINKIATLRNARGGNMPDVTLAALNCEKFGAQGITVHPRPDERHIRYSDVRAIRPLLKTEFNIPAGILFSASFEPERFGLKAEDRRTIGVLRDFVAEYNRELPIDDRKPVTSSRQAAEIIYPVLRGLDHEEVWAMFLSPANLPIDRKMICSGSMNETVTDTRKVVKHALDLNASAIILFHNHPSGNPEPSQADIAETLRDVSLSTVVVLLDSSHYGELPEVERRTAAASYHKELSEHMDIEKHTHYFSFDRDDHSPS